MALFTPKGGTISLSLDEFSELARLASIGDAAGRRKSTVPFRELTPETRRHLYGSIGDFVRSATTDRDFRLKWASAQTGRKITSFNRLSEDEALALIASVEDYS